MMLPKAKKKLWPFALLESWYGCIWKLRNRFLFMFLKQVRHGAASGLREVIKIHGGGAGKQKSMTAEQVSK